MAIKAAKNSARKFQFDDTRLWSGFSFALTWLFIMVYLVIFPMYFDSTGFVYITEAKYRFFVTTSLVYIGLMLVKYVWALSKKEVRLPAPKAAWQSSSLTQKAIAAYLMVIFISALLSEYQEVVWKGSVRYEGFITFFCYCMVFFLISNFGEFDKYHFIALSAVTLAFCAVGLMQYNGLNALGLYPDASMSFFSTHFITTVGNTNMVSGVVCIMLPLLAVGFIVLEDKWRWCALPGIFLLTVLEVYMNVDSGKVGLGVCLLVMLPLAVNSEKRLQNALLAGSAIALGCFVANTFTVSLGNSYITAFLHSIRFGKLSALCLAGGVILFALWYLMYSKKLRVRASSKRLTSIMVCLSALILLAGLALILASANDPSRGLLYQLGQVLHGNFDDSFGSGRMFVWKRAVPMAMKAPLIGTGPDTFFDVFQGYFRSEVVAAQGVVYDFAHNEYIQTLCNYGLLGLGAYLTAIISAAVCAFKYRENNPYILILGASALCYCVQAFFSFSLAMLTPLFFVVFGLLDRLCRDERKRCERNAAQLEQ